MGNTLPALLINLLAALIFSGIFVPLSTWAWRTLRKSLRHPEYSDVGRREREATDEEPLPRLDIPADLSTAQRVVYLEQERSRLEEEVVRARRDGTPNEGASTTLVTIDSCLHEMSFLEEGSYVTDRYRLLSLLGSGRVSVVWKAYDEQADSYVAIKILRYRYANDESIVRQFHYTSQLMSEFSTASIATVRQAVSELPIDGGRKLHFYVLEYVDGVPLDVHLRSHPDQRDVVLDGLFKVGDCIAEAHENGIVHRDLKPRNILVQPGGRLKLVDLDSVLRLGDRRITHHDVGTFGYAAPEVMEGASEPDVRSDIFALARVFAYVLYGESLPNAYSRSVYDVINLLNCSPDVKEALERASAVEPRKRFTDMRAFLAQLRAGVEEDRKNALPPLRTLRREREKIFRILRHSFYGTLLVMLVSRPILTHFQMVHLSDRPWVGLFHSFIGSLVWGVFISFAFLLFLVVFARRLSRTWSKYVVAMVLCGMGGMLGGALVAIPSVFVTNANTLWCLGWLGPPTEAAVGVSAGDRLSVALLTTRMMLSYPLIGLLTGCGLGLCLYRGIATGLRDRPGGAGLLPIPSKVFMRDSRDGRSLAGRLLASPLSHIFLALPIILSAAVAVALDPIASSPDLCGAVLPRPELRSLGEGVVHYTGAVGLVVGFFFGIRTNETTWTHESNGQQ